MYKSRIKPLYNDGLPVVMEGFISKKGVRKTKNGFAYGYLVLSNCGIDIHDISQYLSSNEPLKNSAEDSDYYYLKFISENKKIGALLLTMAPNDRLLMFGNLNNDNNDDMYLQVSYYFLMEPEDIDFDTEADESVVGVDEA